ncbi:putative quinol monooxygenase [Bosea sp. NPDC003192]|uniref:putative quinol monooxygenase n=1 Tax=Bosea sp. NPDC003192 TaxID=3390551 RepID=UPI003D093417
MLKVIAQDFIKPESIELVAPLYRELVEKTRAEPLCLAYDLFVDRKDPGHFVFDEHCRSEHFRRLVPLINRHQRQDCIVTLMDAFEG